MRARPRRALTGRAAPLLPSQDDIATCRPPPQYNASTPLFDANITHGEVLKIVNIGGWAAHRCREQLERHELSPEQRPLVLQAIDALLVQKGSAEAGRSELAAVDALESSRDKGEMARLGLHGEAVVLAVERAARAILSAEAASTLILVRVSSRRPHLAAGHCGMAGCARRAPRAAQPRHGRDRAVTLCAPVPAFCLRERQAADLGRAWKGGGANARGQGGQGADKGADQDGRCSCCCAAARKRGGGRAQGQLPQAAAKQVGTLMSDESSSSMIVPSFYLRHDDARIRARSSRASR